ncbi:hypothetical protein C8T65DRAFT_89514 [Cerioporus squamosus]|nr:hypothetical protein C8T65DRAFT_89514 [Cerioporus squamosus]
MVNLICVLVLSALACWHRPLHHADDDRYPESCEERDTALALETEEWASPRSQTPTPPFFPDPAQPQSWGYHADWTTSRRARTFCRLGLTSGVKA